MGACIRLDVHLQAAPLILTLEVMMLGFLAPLFACALVIGAGAFLLLLLNEINDSAKVAFCYFIACVTALIGLRLSYQNDHFNLSAFVLAGGLAVYGYYYGRRDRAYATRRSHTLS
jgi:hypothetical protein